MGLNEDLEKIAVQERELQLPRLDARTAWELGSCIRAIALERSLCVVIDVRRFGQPLFYAALDGTTPDNPDWVRRKSNVVARFHRSSYAVGLTQKSKGTTLQERQGLPLVDYATDGGSFPLAVTGASVVGSVTVSGLPQRDDHCLVVEGLCALLGRDYGTLKLGPGPAE
ncbi:MAG: heme-degrading domain-containing protein [Terracidiphilus sp.]